MTDRRRLMCNARVAHVSLQGQVTAERFTEGEWRQVCIPRLDLLSAADGGRDRQVLLGEAVLVLEELDGMAFVSLQRDGHVGYVASSALAAPPWTPTHYVSAARSHAKATPDFKAFEPIMDISFGSLLSVTGQDGRWSEIALRGPNYPEGRRVFVPTAHLQPVDMLPDDPVGVAELFLGTPYLWGGNSAFGIDCSGLVQMSLLACGIACPGDSDMQAAELGEGEAYDSYRRGDLLFWKGHVAWVADPQTILHANAHHMAVAFEPLTDAIARIEAQGEGPVTRHARLSQNI
ncbi:C40 family peptidase [Primorskyibacter marinus]|uniref:C40 family peptidase n=1 Tax=Primorskyibacter marinus TaxID=1977320 RepID=UPI000E30887F|nr:NlpC/P60 family protein [Primorskyibacter marinus]